MMLISCLFLWPVLVLGANTDVTFRNVRITGYNKNFTKYITADSLKDVLPNEYYYRLEIVDQHIPKLKENAISDLEYLNGFILERCDLETIEPGAFKNLPFLFAMSLKNNKLKKIGKGVFNHLVVGSLDLSKNQLQTIDGYAFDNMPRLFTINLGYNLISEWNNRWFKNTPSLWSVSMENNSLQYLPDEAFTNLKERTGNFRLSLRFSYNQITRISKTAFNGVADLESLWLDNNQLTDFSDKILEGVSIKKLVIQNNNIKCFKGDLSKIIKAEVTHLDINPFECSCVVKLKTWIKQHNKKADLFYADATCAIARLDAKLDQIGEDIRKLKAPKDVEEVTSVPDFDFKKDVEILF